MRIDATQDGRTVTITGTITLPGEPPDRIWNAVSGTLDEDGNWTAPRGANYVDEDCGQVRQGPRELRFSDNDLRY